MKTEIVLEEMKKAMKKIEKDNKLKTLIFVGVGLAIVIVGIIVLVSKLRDKAAIDALDNWDDWDDEDYADYEDYDDDEYSFDDTDVDYDEEYTED